MRIDIAISGDHINADLVKGKTVIVVDTLRATTVIITSLVNGAKSVVPVSTVEDALSIMKRMENAVLGGERKAKKIEGFNFSNSPLEYSKSAISGKNVILTTTNGTKAISKSKDGARVLIGALVNAKAVARKAHGFLEDIIIVNSGTDGKFTMDDFITGGAIVEEILAMGNAELTDIAKTALLIYRSHKDIRSYVREAAHYRILEELGLDDDIDFCLQKDIFAIVPEFDHGVIKLPEGQISLL
jgi:2-phosphosulfolactate phosphatase